MENSAEIQLHFWFVFMFTKIHFEIGVGLLSDFIIDLSEQTFLPEKVTVQNPKPSDRKE